MSIAVNHAPEVTIYEDSEVSERIYFTDSTGAYYWPSTSVTCKATAPDGTTTTITVTYSGTASTGGTFRHIPASSGIHTIEWAGVDASRPSVSYQLVVLVRALNAF